MQTVIRLFIFDETFYYKNLNQLFIFRSLLKLLSLNFIGIQIYIFGILIEILVH